MPFRLDGPGTFRVEVVGESHYQDALERLSGGRKRKAAEVYVDAMLVCEDDNPHDRDAVRVDVRGTTVGHLARDMAPLYRRYLAGLGRAGQAAECRAVIVGGWDRGGDDVGHFGARLDLPPLRARWRLQPQNYCPDCRATWYPRNADRSDRCPGCGSPRVQLARVAAVKGAGGCAALPFLVLALVIQAAAAAVVGVVRLGWRAARGGAQRPGPRGVWVAGQLRPHLVTAARRSASGAAFLARWVASAKDDLLGDDDVNPVTLIGKLCAFVVIGIAVGVVVVKVVRWVI